MQRVCTFVGHAVVTLGGVLVGILLVPRQTLRVDLGVEEVMGLGGLLGGMVVLVLCGYARDWADVRGHRRAMDRSVTRRHTRLAQLEQSRSVDLAQLRSPRGDEAVVGGDVA